MTSSSTGSSNKIQWSGVKEQKLIFPLFLSKFNFSKIYTQLIYHKNFLFIFIDYDLIIYSLTYNNKNSTEKNSTNTLDVNETQKEISLTFESKKSLDFFSLDEEILFIKYSDTECEGENLTNSKHTNFSNFSNKPNFSENYFFNFIIGTNLGNIFLINFNITDFYLEISQTFNIRHNYIHEYEILFYTKEEGENSHSILMTMDKHLFLLEFPHCHGNQKSHTNSPISLDNKILKNLLLRIEDPQEKIINAYLKPKHYTVIFSNKAIYFLNFETDGASEIIFKKDQNFYNSLYSGYVNKDVIYYIKDSNSFSIFHIYDRENKFTIKLSAKNQLNELGFYKVFNVDDEIITITNEKQSELYFIMNNKFKLIHRESILFDKSFFIFAEDSVVVISLNLFNLSLKYKYAILSSSSLKPSGQIKDNKNLEMSKNPSQKRPRKNSESILSENINFDLNQIELSFMDSKNNIQNLKFKLKKVWKRIYFLMKNLAVVMDYNKFEVLKQKICRKMNKIIKLSINFQSGNLDSRYESASDKKCKNCPSLDETNSLTSLKFSHSKINFLKYQIINSYIQKFGSEALLKSIYILIDYLKNLHEEKIKNLIKISVVTRDKEVYLSLIKLMNKL
jgi:uncharacterized short protein YbdD (DUF466 family)